MKVAVDGPAGSGKSSVCKILADRYGLVYLDTGAMYRAAAWILSELRPCNLIKTLEETEFVFLSGGSSLFLKINGSSYDVTKDIRSPAVSALVSEVASNPEVRRILTSKQRAYASNADIIMDGRDIGTVVFPDAEVKIYLTATAEERARRRFAEWKNGSVSSSFEEVLQNIVKRDEADSSRLCAPLAQAADAVKIDTTGVSLDEAAVLIGNILEEKIRPPK